MSRYAFEGGRLDSQYFSEIIDGVYTDENNLDLEFDDVSGAAAPRITISFTGYEPDTSRRLWEAL